MVDAHPRAPAPRSGGKTCNRLVNEQFQKFKQIGGEPWHGIVFRAGVNEVNNTIAFLENMFDNF